MNIKTTLLALFSITSVIADNARAATLGKKYNLLTTKGRDPFAGLSDFSLAAAQPVTVEFDDANFTSVTLTNEQARHVANVVTQAGDLFEADTLIKLPPITYTPADQFVQNDIAESADTNTPTIITGIPVYPGTLHGQDVVIMDAYIYPKVAMLNGYKVKIVESFVGDTPCLAHGTNVAEVIAQMFDPKKTDLEFLNFAVFDCAGSANYVVLGQAISAIIKYKHEHSKHRGLTVNFSGSGAYSQILNTMFQKLTKHHINVMVAAGNDQESCNLASPASAAATTHIQSIGATQGQSLAYYSNYATPNEPCVDLYLPGCLPMTDPTTGAKQIGCGTSFASPMEAGRVMVYKHKNKHTAPTEIKAFMRNDTVSVPGPNGVAINSITADMAFNWKKQRTAHLRGKTASPTLRA